MTELLLRGGLVWTGTEMVEADVLVVDGSVARLGRVPAHGAEVLDCAGAWVGPGFVDLHCHLREPGGEWKEDLESGSEAAAAGGYVALVAMPNTVPPIDTGHLARYVSDRGRAVGLLDVVPAGALTMGLEGAQLAHLDELLGAGVTMFTDDGRTLADTGLLRRAMEYLGPEKAVLAQHPEDIGASREGHMHEGDLSARLGIGGIPRLAEELVVARDLALVRMTRARYHVQHVSCAGTAELVRRAKREGLPVTAEVTPHHLALDHSVVASMDPRYKMYPPLRERSDIEALRAALADGTLDAVATDHAPHAAHEKEVPFEEAPRGVIGLETAAAVVNTFADLGPIEFFDRMSARPAEIAGLEGHGGPVAPGTPANLVVFDPEWTWRVSRFVSRSDNSPFVGERLTGSVRFTLFRGRPTWAEGKVVR